MKKIIFFIGAAILITACAKRLENLELFSAQSFAYTMESGWEMNASVRVKGFEQHESNNKYSAKLSYTIDVVTSDGKLIESIDSGLIDKTAAEKMTDIEINSQLKFDSSYKTGAYKITFNVTDDFNQRKTSFWSFFDLNK